VPAERRIQPKQEPARRPPVGRVFVAADSQIVKLDGLQGRRRPKRPAGAGYAASHIGTATPNNGATGPRW
jgi:hypothetical protein